VIDMPTVELPMSLRVDGIDSPMIDMEALVPVFNQKIHIP
jgi:hypothetical protein